MFKLLIIIYVFIFSLRDDSEKELKKDKKDWKKLMGRNYE